MDEYIEVKIDVFEHVGQRARLRKALTIRALVEEILKEFDDVVADSPEKYAIYLRDMDRPLASNASVAQLDLQPQDELIFKYVLQNSRRMLDPQHYAVLRDETTGRAYDILWQPAIIGRPNNDAEHNINLAVNLETHAKGLTVSRKHAQITFSGGHYYLESLAENNPVAVNGRQIVFGARQELKNGDKVSIGRKDLLMTFMRQAGLAAVPRTVRQSAVSQEPVVPSPRPDAVAVAPAEAPQPKTPAAPAGPPAAALFIEQATDATMIGQRVNLPTYPNVIGRDTPAFSAEKDVSRRHAEVNYDPAARRFTITDLNSTNGVYIDNLRVEAGRAHEIRPGIRFSLGSHLVLRLEI